MRQSTPNCIPNPIFKTKRTHFRPLFYPRFTPLRVPRSHARLTANLTAATPTGSRWITRVHGRVALASPLPCRPTGTTPHKRRKRLNFAPSAHLRLILPPTQQQRPHSRRKPAMQPHNIKAN